MKSMKKLASLLLALVMVLSLATTAFAAEPLEANGTITINNALKGETYSIYRIFDLETYSGTNYSYKLSEKWNGFTSTSFTVNEDGYINWVADNSEAAAAAFAAEAIAYAVKNSIANDGTATAASTTVEFTSLLLGYYLVDTTMGSICSLNTTAPDAVIQEKNQAPSVEKEVEEDSTGAYGETNDADITQTVNFKTTITVQKGTENFVLHDTMDAGFTLDPDSITVAGATAGTDYTVATDGLTDGCTFEVKFEDSYISKLAAGDKVVVTYSATLNNKAVVGTEGNKNTTYITYGAAQTSEEDHTVTKTWGVDLTKVDGTTKEALQGATFVLYKEITIPATEEGAEATTSKKYAIVADGKLTGWADTEEAATKLTSDKNGLISVDGLDSDTYWFKETDAPAGYNLLKSPAKVTIDNNNATITVENNAGSELPSTGGMGTTLFYALGGILMLAAVVLLVTKKRMAA